MSRRSAIGSESASSSRPVSSGSRITAGRAPANGRSSSTQPSGLAQRSQPAFVAVSATTRTANATASTPNDMASARRRFGAIWLASAPTPTNTGTGDTTASARYAEPPTGSRVAARPTNVASHRTSAPAPIAASDAAIVWRRLTGSASTSSWRPVSSSVRIARTAASSPQTAANSDRIPPTRHAL